MKKIMGHLQKKSKKTLTRELESEWGNLKTVASCVEAATMDTYGEYEQASGWLTCLEEIFSDIDEIRFMGELVKLKGLNLHNDLCVVAVIEKNGKKAKVSLDSIELIRPTKCQALWLQAYLEQGGNL